MGNYFLENAFGVLCLLGAEVFPKRRAGEGGNQFAGVFVLRRIEDSFGRAALDDLSFVKDADAVAESRNREQVVGDIEDGRAHLVI